MRFDKEMALLKENLVSDGMGGYESTGFQQVGTIYALTTPVTAEIMMKEYGIVSTSAMKIFTKDEFDEENVQIEYLDKKYEILQHSDYGKFRMLLVQEIT